MKQIYHVLRHDSLLKLIIKSYIENKIEKNGKDKIYTTDF